MRRPGSLIVAAAGVAAFGPSSCQAAEDAPEPVAKPLVESFSDPLSAWSRHGLVRARRIRTRGETLLRLSATGRGGGRLERELPGAPWALSLDVALRPTTTVALGLGGRRPALRLSRSTNGTVLARRPDGRTVALRGSANPPSRRWVHLQAYQARRSVRIALGSRRLRLNGPRGARLSVSVRRGRLELDNLIATPAKDRAGLLLHRLAALQSRVPPSSSLVGVDRNDRLHLRSRFWTRGFFAGSLWQAAELTPGSDLFPAWALRRTVANFGDEDADSHDMGFMYETTSVAAYRRLCRSAQRRARGRCRRLRASGLAAARQLMALARTNAGAGTIPTRLASPSRQESDTIIDSLMNLPLLYWATRVTGDGSFRAVAARHARRVESLLLRRDGSTAQSVHQNRQTGRLIRIHSHQGISAASTWARGQGWAIYGLTTSAEELNDRGLLAAAETAARWAADHLPRSGVPRYDYDASPGADVDTSAGVITAAGLFRLGRACGRQPGACAEADRWKPLAQRMLLASLRHVSTALPLGFFGRQTATHGGVRWDDQAELVYGLYYALEGVQTGLDGT
jgi:unsaturated chondroitin disaccharide hydrolase